MAMPRMNQAKKRDTRPLAKASISSPTINRRFDAHRTERPPRLSMSRPHSGPKNAEMPSPKDNATNTHGADRRRSRAIGTARMAGR